MTRRVHAVHAIAAIALFALAFAVAHNARRLAGVDLMEWMACECTRRECLAQFCVVFVFAAAGTLGMGRYLHRGLGLPGAVAVAGAAFWVTSAVHASSASFGPLSLTTFLLLPLIPLFASMAASAASARYALAAVVVVSAIHGGGAACAIFFVTSLVALLGTPVPQKPRSEALVLVTFAFAASAFAWMPYVLEHQVFAARGAFRLAPQELGVMLLNRLPAVNLGRFPGGFARHVAFVGWPLLVLSVLGVSKMFKKRFGAGSWMLATGIGGVLCVPMSYASTKPLFVSAMFRFPLALGLCIAAAIGLHRLASALRYDSRLIAQRRFLALFVFAAASVPVADALLFASDLAETRTSNAYVIEPTECVVDQGVREPFWARTFARRRNVAIVASATSGFGLAGLFFFALLSRLSARRARREFLRHLTAAPPSAQVTNAPLAQTSNLPLFREPRAYVVERFAPSFARSLVVGFFAAEALALTDAFVGTVRPRGQNASAEDVLVSALHLLAFYAPVGWLAGAAFHAIELARMSFLRRFVPADQERTSIASERRAASSLLTAVVLAALGTSAVIVASNLVIAKIHRASVVPVAIGLSALAIAAICALLFRVVRAIVDTIVRAVLPALTLRIVALATLIATPFFVAPTLLSMELAWSSFDAVALAFPGLLFAYSYALSRVRPFGNSTSNAGAQYTIPFLALATICAVASSASTFGARFGARTFVEERSVAGRTLLRAYSSIADRDGDGYAFAFGGGDCNDDNANVHPGAFDRPGDGVDNDCFGGDGSREVDTLTTGAYASMPARTPRYNILLITIDALRPDALGTYHAERDTSPNIDRFAEDAVVFERAIAQAPRSLRSITSFFTGLYPSQIAYGPELLWPSFKPENVTLAEALRDSGYQTSAVMGTSYFHAFSGFFQGFEKVDEANGFHAPRTWTFDHAAAELERLRGTASPWFLWAHSLNVHEPYLADRHASRYGPGRRAAYDTEVHLMDAQLEKLLDALRESGQYENTIIVIASDHGEAFGEHGLMTHGHSLYDEELRSTLIVRVPGMAPRRVRETVPLFDLTPTLLNLAGVPMPARVPSRSLVGVMQGTDLVDPNRLIFSELAPDGLEPFDLKSVRRGNHTLIWSVRDGSFRLYDHHVDPLQSTNLADENIELRTALEGIVRSWAATRARPSAAKAALIEASLLDAFPREMTERFSARHANDIMLVGYDLPTRTFSVGDTIPLVLYHEALGTVDDDYLFNILFKATPTTRLPANFHGSHRPVNGHFQTREWRRGMKIRDAVPVVIPDDIRHPITLDIELHVTANGQRVDFATPTGPRGAFSLGRIEIR